MICYWHSLETEGRATTQHNTPQPLHTFNVVQQALKPESVSLIARDTGSGSMAGAELPQPYRANIFLENESPLLVKGAV